MTIALVITTSISLALLATGFLVTNMTERTKEIYLDRVEVMIQLDEDTSAADSECVEEACTQVREELEALDGVDSITYRSREQSYDRFVEVFQYTDPVLVAETSADALPAAFHVRLADPLAVEILDPIRELPQVSAIIDQVDDLRGATENLDSIRNFTFVTAAVQILASIFLIANMVQIAAFSRREETEIMRIVGASRWYTEAPFVVEAILATLIGALLAAGALFMAKEFVIDEALRGLYESQLIAPITQNDIWTVTPIISAIGVLVAGVIARVTLRFYVRK